MKRACSLTRGGLDADEWSRAVPRSALPGLLLTVRLSGVLPVTTSPTAAMTMNCGQLPALCPPVAAITVTTTGSPSLARRPDPPIASELAP